MLSSTRKKTGVLKRGARRRKPRKVFVLIVTMMMISGALLIVFLMGVLKRVMGVKIWLVRVMVAASDLTNDGDNTF